MVAAACTGGAAMSRRCPHSAQNFAVGATAKPQIGQALCSRWPHSSQNLAVGLLSCWQCAHCICTALLTCPEAPSNLKTPAAAHSARGTILLHYSMPTKLRE